MNKVFVVKVIDNDSFSTDEARIVDTVITAKKTIYDYRRKLENYGYKLDEYFCDDLESGSLSFVNMANNRNKLVCWFTMEVLTESSLDIILGR